MEKPIQNAAGRGLTEINERDRISWNLFFSYKALRVQQASYLEKLTPHHPNRPLLPECSFTSCSLKVESLESLKVKWVAVTLVIRLHVCGTNTLSILYYDILQTMAKGRIYPHRIRKASEWLLSHLIQMDQEGHIAAEVSSQFAIFCGQQEPFWRSYGALLFYSGVHLLHSFCTIV